MARFGRRGGTRQNTTSNLGTGSILSAFSVLLIPLWILAGGAWIVQVTGLGLCQHDEVSGGHFLQFDWFVTMFEVFVLLLLPFPLILRRSSPGIAALLAVVTVLEILRTNVWNDARLSRGDVNGVARTQIDSVVNPGLNATTKRINTVFSGYLITSVFNLLLILGLGSLPAHSAQDARAVEYNARDAADRNKVGADNYNANNGVNQPGVNSGVAHNGGVGGPVHNGVDHV